VGIGHRGMASPRDLEPLYLDRASFSSNLFRSDIDLMLILDRYRGAANRAKDFVVFLFQQRLPILCLALLAIGSLAFISPMAGVHLRWRSFFCSLAFIFPPFLPANKSSLLPPSTSAANIPPSRVPLPTLPKKNRFNPGG